MAIPSAAMERNKTKEQLEEEKRISLSIRIQPLKIEGMSVDKLRLKAQELWDCIVKLETEKYDLEEKQKRQEYDVSIIFMFNMYRIHLVFITEETCKVFNRFKSNLA